MTTVTVTSDTKSAAETRASLTVCIINIIAIILPLLGFIAAIVHSWGWGFNWIGFSLLIAMYVLTVLGITVGFHRLFTHRAFETGRVMQCILAILGSMAMQGPLLKWVALHRMHHQHSDTHDDPHSPTLQNRSFLGTLRGAWHAHMGWFFESTPPDIDRYIKDLSRNRFLCVISALFPLWVALGLFIPAAIGGWITGTWTGALLGLLWGGLARMFLVHHVTWSINSICHLWGHRTYATKDQSRNNVVFGLLALGEGWHNNHHAFPASARHGLQWWQLDISYIVIRLMAITRLAWKIRLPSASTLSSAFSIAG